MQTVTAIYFFYMFVSIYFLILTIVIYLQNRKDIFSSPPITRKYTLSVIIPAWNEEKTIASTIHHVFASDYAKLIQVIVINDGSTDGTLKIAKSLSGKYKNLLVLNKTNSGKADSVNYALKYAKGELVSVIDADSFPGVSAFSKLVGYFDDQKVGAVTASCTPKNRNSLLEKLQTIEYKVIAFTRKLLGYIESIYVAPGSLSIYRKKVLLSVGGFDPENITEDIESTWHILSEGWKVRMCLSASVKTSVPNKIAPWFKQRTRWGLGGLQVLNKYKKFIFTRGIFGYFIIPFFIFGWLLGLVGMAIFAYLSLKNFIARYLFLDYASSANVAFLSLSDLAFTPSVLNYFGFTLLLLFFIFTLFVLAIMKDNLFEKQSFFNLLFYMTVYLLIYPIVTIVSIYRWIRGDMRWR